MGHAHLLCQLTSVSTWCALLNSSVWVCDPTATVNIGIYAQCLTARRFCCSRPGVSWSLVSGLLQMPSHSPACLLYLCILAAPSALLSSRVRLGLLKHSRPFHSSAHCVAICPHLSQKKSHGAYHPAGPSWPGHLASLPHLFCSSCIDWPPCPLNVLDLRAFANLHGSSFP